MLTDRARHSAWVLSVIVAVSLAMALLICLGPLLERDIGEVLGITETGLPEYYVYFLAGAAGVLVLAVAFVRPFWGLLFVMLLLPFRSEEYALADIGGAIIRVADPVALFTFLGLLNREILARRRGLPLKTCGIELPLLALVWWTFLSFAWCHDYGTAISKLLQFSYALVLFYMVLALVDDRRKLMFSLYVWVIAGIVIGGLALAEAAAGMGDGGGRAETFQTSAIETGEYLNYGVLIAIGLFMATRNRLAQAFLLGSTAGMLAGTILGSASRGPLVGLAAGLIFLYVVQKPVRTLIRLSIPAVVAGCVAAVFVVGLFGENLLELTSTTFRRFIELAETPELDPGLAYRLDIWDGIWQIYQEHPVFGIGVGSLPELLPSYTSDMFQDPQLAHNMYLEVGIALGPLGFLLFCWFAFRVARILLPYLWERADWALHAVFVCLLASQVAKLVESLSFGMFYEDRVAWVALALCFAAARLLARSEGTGAEPELSAVAPS